MPLADSDRRRIVHDALEAWSRSPGRLATSALATTLRQLPELADAADRIDRSGGVGDDWLRVVAADRPHEWPAVEAVARGAVSKIELLLTDEMVRLTDGGDATGFSLDGARVTWQHGALSIGAAPRPPDAIHRYVEELGACTIGAALSWVDAEPAAFEAASVGVVHHRHDFANYYHWLLGAVRTAVLLEITGRGAALDRLIVFTTADPPSFVGESIDALAVDRDRIDVRREPLDRVFRQVCVTTPNQLLSALPIPEYAAHLRARLDLAPRIGHGRRLLVSRGDAAHRRVANEEDLAAALDPYGFETIRPGELSFLEQVDAFASAELVIAPHGAALANLLFCTPGTSVVEFRNEGLDRPFFERLASDLRLPYLALPCLSDEPRNDFVVDVGATVRAVDELGRSRQPQTGDANPR